MLTTTASPTIRSTSHIHPDSHYSRRPHYENPARSPTASSAFTRPRILNPAQPTSRPPSLSRSPASSKTDSSDVKSGGLESPGIRRKTPPRVRMVDVGTQYSPPLETEVFPFGKKTPTSSVARLRLTDPEVAEIPKITNNPDAAGQAADPAPDPSSSMTEAQPQRTVLESPVARGKRFADSEPRIEEKKHDSTVASQQNDLQQVASKRLRPETPAVRLMPLKYETCNPHDLAIVISSMLMELIRYNDAIPLRDGHLTRFHSRAPPGISVSDYLQRLTTHATLSPPILLSMVYYIDKLCALYPAFTISSLTVHRFLITSATVASKGLSDSFWTNKTYARVGGVSLKELALLELEFLSRVEWRIVPKPEVLVDYYRSLIERSDGYELNTTANLEDSATVDNSALS